MSRLAAQHCFHAFRKSSFPDKDGFTLAYVPAPAGGKRRHGKDVTNDIDKQLSQIKQKKKAEAAAALLKAREEAEARLRMVL